MTPFPTQGRARAWGGECFAMAKRTAKAGTTPRPAQPLKSALPGGLVARFKWSGGPFKPQAGAARRGRAMGAQL